MIKVGIIGDFDEAKPSHEATNKALQHCAKYLHLDLECKWLPTITLEGDIKKDICDFDAFWCAPGSPYRSFKGAINAIRFARENNYPFIGTCGGFQHAIMEYAQNVLGMAEVNHEEYNPDASTFFISALSCSLLETTRKIYLKEGTKSQEIYGQTEIEERYNCNFGLNGCFQDTFDKSGLHVAGVDSNGEVRIFELSPHRFYVATLFQPQLSSTPETPHKLIVEYLLETQKFHNEHK
ncbi:CTP synthase C-terminal region-related (seleno)protein [Propionispora hippei]|uniref:CTP synthase (glutamine hydrolyzing) n=1 Tax=Propionispora hippei DSM 15287 TaxID=1123003 RepID=A0A1M6FSP0_9FIRM|nr:glutamine amidotransferase [Propionispora hippei]SHJ00704.1 Glutamine amidotransferase class-I [Propionispora hippei DSM 15287]